MTMLSETSDQFKAAGILLVPVASIPEHGNDMSFAGTLGEYIQVAKTLQAPAVFASPITITEDFFTHFIVDEGEFDISPEPLDLCQFVPELKQFKKRIGEDGHIDLLLPLLNCQLKFSVFEDWMVTFTNLRSEAVQLAEERSASELEKLHANEHAKTQSVLQQLHELMTDQNFVCLRTQRAMLAYAQEKVPGLEIIDERDLKREIQMLSAKIEAKGIGRK